MSKNTNVTFVKGEATKILPEGYRAQMTAEGWTEESGKSDLKSQLAAASGKKAAKTAGE